MRRAGLDTEAIKEVKLSATNGRTDSSREMTHQEASALIKALKLNEQPKQDFKPKPGQAQRRKIISICHDMRWFENATGKVNIHALNAWLLEKGVVKKELNNLSVAELNKTVTQFESIQRKAYK